MNVLCSTCCPSFLVYVFLSSVLSFLNHCLRDFVFVGRPLFCQSCLLSRCPGKMDDLGICSCLFLSCSQIFEFFRPWLCSMSFLCFLFFLLLIVLWILFLCPVVFVYCFTLLASLAFRSFASHCCLLFSRFLLLWLLLVFLLHFLVFYCSSGCFDLLSFFASF